MSHDLEDLKKEESFHEDRPTVEVPELLGRAADAPTADAIQQGYALLDSEKTRSAWEALAQDWRQVVHCLPYLLACMGQGYDAGANGISGAMPAFLIKFGEFNPETHRPFVPSMWLSLWSSFLTLGIAIGNAVCGPLIDRFGPRKTIMASSVLMLGAVSLQTAAVNREMLLVGKLLAGIPMGIFVVGASNFVSEAVTTRLRAIVSSGIYMSVIIGLVCGLTTGYERIAVIDDGWGSWRLLFAMQYIFPGLTALLLLLCADSPIFWIKKGRVENARKQLDKLYGEQDESTASARMAVLRHVVAMEQEAHSHFGSVGWGELFSNPVDRKRTLTSIGVMLAQPLGGASFIAQSLYFLSQLGIDFSMIFSISIGLVALGGVASLASGFLLDYFGRRSIFIYGNVVMLLVLAAIGGLGFVESSSAGWALALLINLAISVQNFAVNAPSFTYTNELSSFRLRAKTQAISLAGQNVLLCLLNVMTPYVFQAPGDLGAKTAFIFVGPQALVIVFGILYLPETRRRTPAEIDVLYERRVHPSKFESTDVASLL